jgi:hypothetical protein
VTFFRPRFEDLASVGWFRQVFAIAVAFVMMEEIVDALAAQIRGPILAFGQRNNSRVPNNVLARIRVAMTLAGDAALKIAEELLDVFFY